VIIVGIDGSDHSKRALRWAVAEAELRKTPVKVIYAWLRPYTTGWGYVPHDLFDPIALQEQARTIVDAAVDEIVRPDGVEIDAVAAEGAPAGVLLDAAVGADLLVVGSRGRGGFVGLLLGSVSQQCAQHASCPVVIVRHDVHDEADGR
jgi:nucleotide-binding universal stress UspA family protein